MSNWPNWVQWIGLGFGMAGVLCIIIQKQKEQSKPASDSKQNDVDNEQINKEVELTNKFDA